MDRAKNILKIGFNHGKGVRRPLRGLTAKGRFYQFKLPPLALSQNLPI
jgi:hypothetical protein